MMLNEIFRVPCLRDAQDKDDKSKLVNQVIRDDTRIPVGSAVIKKKSSRRLVEIADMQTKKAKK